MSILEYCRNNPPDQGFVGYIWQKEGRLRNKEGRRISSAGVVGMEFAEAGARGLRDISEKVRRNEGSGVRLTRHVIAGLPKEDQGRLRAEHAAVLIGEIIVAIDDMVIREEVSPRVLIDRVNMHLQGTLVEPWVPSAIASTRKLSGVECVPLWRNKASDPAHTSYLEHGGAALPVELRTTIASYNRGILDMGLQAVLPEYDMRAQVAVGKKVERDWTRYPSF